MLVHYIKISRFSIKFLQCISSNECANKWARLLSNQVNHVQNNEKLTKPWRVLFYGTDRFSEFTLKALNSNRLSIDEQQVVKQIDVVCVQVDCPVRRYAESEKLTIHSWPYTVPPDTYDIGVVVSFGHLIPSKSIIACKYGVINAHPSLLPRWRGAAPIVHAILNGDLETGVTIIQIAPKKFDVGNIIVQYRCPIPSQCTSQQLTTMLGSIASNMVLKTLEDLPLLIKNSYPQAIDGITHAHKLTPSMGYINWFENSPYDVDRKMRAFKGFIKMYTFWKEEKINLLGTVPPEEVSVINLSNLVPNDILPGYCYFHKKRRILFVKCKDGWTGITSMTISLRKEITALELYNGYLSKVPSNQRYFISKDECKKFEVN